MSTETKTKTETPKTETPKTEANPFAAFDPMAFWATSQQTFQKAMGDAYGRAHSFADQYAALESQLVVRTQAAVASWAQLAQDAISYSAQLSAEARKLGFETCRKMSVGA
jgi:hypothetical protein